jgi:hypothetical protein
MESNHSVATRDQLAGNHSYLPSSTSFLLSALIIIYLNVMIELAAAYLLPKMVTDKGGVPIASLCEAA